MVVEASPNTGGFFNFLKKPFQALADSPNAQIALSDLGAMLDPKGAGGIIGTAGKNYIKSKQTQNIFGADGTDGTSQEVKLDPIMTENLTPITDAGPVATGGITPDNMEGPNKIVTTSNLPGGLQEVSTKTLINPTGAPVGNSATIAPNTANTQGGRTQSPSPFQLSLLG